MNLLRLSISPLPAPAGWYVLPLRLIIGFGFMQHGYAKLAAGLTTSSVYCRQWGFLLPPASMPV